MSSDLPDRSADFTPRPQASAEEPPTVIAARAPFPTPAAAESRAPAWALALEGQMLAHFRVERFIGGGGMGAVFRGLDLKLQRPAALKLLPPEQAADADTLRRFENEARSAARLDHPHVARVYFAGEDRGFSFIAFEYVEGENLRDRVLREGPLPLGDTVRITRQLATALIQAAGRDVVHRDIKPSNVLITADGSAKLVDLGLARLLDANASGDLTATGMTLGTFDYLAPEQARDPRAADVRSDIYSLGCTWYYMLTGRPPFPEGTVLQKLLQHHGDEVPDARTFRSDLSDAAWRIVRRMLAKDAQSRYPSPEALVSDLTQLAADEEISLDDQLPGVVRPRRRWLARWEQHLPWAAPVILLLLFVWGLDLFTRPDVAPERTLVAQNQPLSEMGGAAAQSPPNAAKPGNLPEVSDSDRSPRFADSPSKQPTEIPQATPSLESPIESNNRIDGDRIASDRISGDGQRESERQSSVSQPQPVTNPLNQPPERIETQRTQSPGFDSRLSSGTGTQQGVLPQPQGPSSPMPRGEFTDLERPGLVPSDSTQSPENAGFPTSIERANPDRIVDSLGNAFPSPTFEGTRTTSVPSANVPQGLRIVADRLIPGIPTYPTLRAACSAARSGDCIELRFDGPRLQPPLELSLPALTIRAGEGFRPMLLFRPSPQDGFAASRGMLRLAGGRLTVLGVDLALDLPRSVAADRWALFVAEGAQFLRLERCTLTIRNASDLLAAFHDRVAFVALSPGLGRETLPGVAVRGGPPLRLELQDSVIRGEAALLDTEHADPWELSGHNLLASISEPLAVIRGSNLAGRPEDLARIELRHATVSARGGLLRWSNSQDAPFLLPCEVDCVDSILQVDAAAPLIEQRGIDTVRGFRSRLTWNGDRNFYQGFVVFWKVDGIETSGQADQATFSLWQSLERVHENLPLWGKVRWRRGPAANLPRHRHAPADYQLADESVENPARRGASDGRDAGAVLENLPRPADLPLAGEG